MHLFIYKINVNSLKCCFVDTDVDGQGLTLLVSMGFISSGLFKWDAKAENVEKMRTWCPFRTKHDFVKYSKDILIFYRGLYYIIATTTTSFKIFLPTEESHTRLLDLQICLSYVNGYGGKIILLFFVEALSIQIHSTLCHQRVFSAILYYVSKHNSHNNIIK